MITLISVMSAILIAKIVSETWIFIALNAIMDMY